MIASVSGSSSTNALPCPGVDSISIVPLSFVTIVARTASMPDAAPGDLAHRAAVENPARKMSSRAVACRHHVGLGLA